MGVFGEMMSEDISMSEMLQRRLNVKSSGSDKLVQTEPLDRIDLEKIAKIKEKLHLVSVRKISALEQVTISFENTENYFVIFNKNENGGGWNDFIGLRGEKERVKNYEGKIDTYVSTASYVSKKIRYDEDGKRLPRRSQSNAKDSVTLTQDCDYYKTGMTEDEALDILAAKIHQGTIEMPHFLIFSGNGMQLVWLIDNVMVKKNSGPERLFKAVQSHLLRSLKELNSDKVTLTPSNVIRLANTINGKNLAKVRAYELRNGRLKLGYFKENYLPIPKPNRKINKPKKAFSKDNKATILHDTRLWNLYTLNYQRAEDIFRILDYKQAHNESVVGIRQLLALVLRFHVLVYSNGDYDLAKEKVVEFWDRLEDTSNTSLEEIMRRSATAERYYKEWTGELPFKPSKKYPYPGLFYRNSTLVSKDVFDLSTECQIGLKTIKIRNKEYELIRDGIRRKKKGVRSHEEKKTEKMELIKAVLKEEPNLSLRQIAEKTGIPKDTASRIIKEFELK